MKRPVFRLKSLMRLREWDRIQAAQALAESSSRRRQAEEVLQRADLRLSQGYQSLGGQRHQMFAAGYQAAHLLDMADRHALRKESEVRLLERQKAEQKDREKLRETRESERVLERLEETFIKTETREALKREDAVREDLTNRKFSLPKKELS